MAEDALTDGLAYLLRNDSEVAASFASLLGFPQGLWCCCSADTQCRVPRGRVDLEVVLAQGPLRRLVWLEAKTSAPEHGDQLDTYQRALRTRETELGAADSQIVTLAPFAHPIEAVARAQGLRHLTWQDVLTSVVLVGEGRGGIDWRRRATSHDAPAGLCDLLDFAWRLEHVGVAVNVAPLQDQDEFVADRAGTLLNPQGVIGVLLDAITEHDGLENPGRYPSRPGSVALTMGRILSDPIEPSNWLARLGSAKVELQLWFSTTDARHCDGINGQPGFLAGVVFGPGVGEAALPTEVKNALSDPEWHATLPPNIYVGSPPYDEIWLVGTIGLSQIATDAPDLDGQMGLLRGWFKETRSHVLATAPPPRWSRNTA